MQLADRQTQGATTLDPMSWYMWLTVALRVALLLSSSLALARLAESRLPWRVIVFFTVAAMAVEALLPQYYHVSAGAYRVQAAGWIFGLVLHTVCAYHLWVVALQTAVTFKDTIMLRTSRLITPWSLAGLLVGLLLALLAGCVPVAVSIVVQHAQGKLVWDPPSTPKSTAELSTLGDIAEMHAWLSSTLIGSFRLATLCKLLVVAHTHEVQEETGVVMSVILGGTGVVLYIILMIKPGWAMVCADLLGFIFGAWGMSTGFSKGDNPIAVGQLMQVVIVCMVLRYVMPYVGMVSSDNPWFIVTLNSAAAIAGVVSSYV